MIFLTRFSGERFAVNPDLIQRAEATPDTVVTLIDATKLIVTESIDDLSAIVATHRASITAMAMNMAEYSNDGDLATVTGLRTRTTLRVTPEAD